MPPEGLGDLGRFERLPTAARFGRRNMLGLASREKVGAHVGAGMLRDKNRGDVRALGDLVGEVVGVERVRFALVQVEAVARGENDLHAVRERDNLQDGGPLVTGVADGLEG